MLRLGKPVQAFMRLARMDSLGMRLRIWAHLLNMSRGKWYTLLLKPHLYRQASSGLWSCSSAAHEVFQMDENSQGEGSRLARDQSWEGRNASRRVGWKARGIETAGEEALKAMNRADT